MLARCWTFVIVFNIFGCVDYGDAPKRGVTANASSTSAGGGDPTTFQHSFEGQCVSCHEKDRPAADHFASQDCATCHNYPSWSNTAESFSHMPKPEACEQCHARPAAVGLRAYPNQGPPANFDANNPGNGGGHYIGKDCVSCHQTPAEGVTTFTFSHSMPNPGICLPCHYNNAQREHNAADFANYTQDPLGNCISCHVNYDTNQLRNFRPN